MAVSTLGSWLHNPRLKGVDIGPERLGSRPVTLRTGRGDVQARFCPAPEANRAVLLVGGVGGGFDSPAMGLYERLCEALPAAGLSVLRVQYRDPRSLEEAVHDVLAGLRFLLSRGAVYVGLVGHSFGGAVVITAATVEPEVCGVITLATQSRGTEGAAHLAPRPLLLIHGTEDEILRPQSSVYVFREARQPKEITLYDGATHNLDEAADEVFDQVRSWLVRRIGPREHAEQRSPSPT
jgi:pimeloyl-ACP methyl ester carboxylesterase